MVDGGDVNAAVIPRRAISEAPQKHAVFNVTGLLPLSTYVFRVRASSVLGESDWTTTTTANTVEVETDTTLPQPQAASYDSSTRHLEFEVCSLPIFFAIALTAILQNPRTALDLCVLLYVSQSFDGSGTISSAAYGDPWRALDACYRPAITGNVLELVDAPTERLRARFCRRGLELICSQPSDVIGELSTTRPYFRSRTHCSHGECYQSSLARCASDCGRVGAVVGYLQHSVLMLSIATREPYEDDESVENFRHC